MSALRKEPVVKSEESHSFLLVLLLGYFHMGLVDRVPLIFRELHLGGSLVNPRLFLIDLELQEKTLKVSLILGEKMWPIKYFRKKISIT